MPRTCSHCGLEIAGDSRQCPNCGQPQDAPVDTNPQTESDRRFPLWQILPWTLLAAALLLLLPPLLRQKHSQSLTPMPLSAAATIPAMPPLSPALTHPAVSSAAASGASGSQPRVSERTPPMESAPKGAAPVPVSAAPVPLTVTLYSASRNKHVAVGTPVTLSAYAALPPGKSATLAVSYGKDNGPKSLLALAQGSLSSTTWTPFLPGRYLFMASALDSRKNGAFSHPVLIFVDAPARVLVSKPAVPVRVAVQPAPAKPKVAAARPAPARHPTPAAVPYHVAAAVFPVRRIAATLAAALRGRGFHAFVRSGTDGNGKPSYRVETGDFPSKADADAQVRLLKKDGYPSYLFQTR